MLSFLLGFEIGVGSKAEAGCIRRLPVDESDQCVGRILCWDGVDFEKPVEFDGGVDGKIELCAVLEASTRGLSPRTRSVVSVDGPSAGNVTDCSLLPDEVFRTDCTDAAIEGALGVACSDPGLSAEARGSCLIVRGLDVFFLGIAGWPITGEGLLLGEATFAVEALCRRRVGAFLAIGATRVEVVDRGKVVDLLSLEADSVAPTLAMDKPDLIELMETLGDLAGDFPDTTVTFSPVVTFPDVLYFAADGKAADVTVFESDVLAAATVLTEGTGGTLAWVIAAVLVRVLATDRTDAGLSRAPAVAVPDDVAGGAGAPAILLWEDTFKPADIVRCRVSRALEDDDAGGNPWAGRGANRRPSVETARSRGSVVVGNANCEGRRLDWL